MNTQLITQIARCCEVEKAKTDDDHPCRKIVEYQSKELGITDFQLPEPWNGNIDTAEILFISSNPSINKDEHYPTDNWCNNDITDFFTARFENMHKSKYSRYWHSIFKWAGWILLNKQSDEKLSETELASIRSKIAVTEVVHCKSKSEYGVKECARYCTHKWLDKVLTAFNGNIIVVVGRAARGCLKDYAFGNKHIAFIPAPNARGIYNKDRFTVLSQLNNKHVK